MKRIEGFVRSLPLISGLSVGFLLVVDLMLLPSVYTMAGLYPLAFFFAIIGIALFGSFVGAIVGITLNVMLEPGFLDNYLRGE